MANNYTSSYIYNYADPAPAFTRNATTEYPSHQITVRIRLNQSITNDLRDRISSALSARNMTLSASRSSRDVIIVSGTPPENGFDRNNVLNIVRRYNRGAQFA
ncbi:hypothetical protein M758_5G109800 [Ceratodon purpureus]|nr:hypothetical protein M758_5G109800 [Ceratodon purpureus]